MDCEISENEKKLLTLLAFNAFQVYDSCLVGNPVPKVERKLVEIQSYTPGDYVLEVSFLPDLSNPIEAYARLKNSVGVYLGRGSTREEENAHFLQALNGKLIVWTNCRFIKILEHFNERSSYSEQEIKENRVKRALIDFKLKKDSQGFLSPTLRDDLKTLGMGIKTKEDVDRALELHKELWDYFFNLDERIYYLSGVTKFMWPGWEEYGLMKDYNTCIVKNACFICEIMRSTFVNRDLWTCKECLLDWTWWDGGLITIKNSRLVCETTGKSPYSLWRDYKISPRKRKELAGVIRDLPVNKKVYLKVLEDLDKIHNISIDKKV